MVLFGSTKAGPNPAGGFDEAEKSRRFTPSGERDCIAVQSRFFVAVRAAHFLKRLACNACNDRVANNTRTEEKL